MNCENDLELLSASLDGELTPAETAQLQAHLDRCPDCRALQAELATLHEVCSEMDVLPPAGLKGQILSDLPPQRASKVIYWKRWGATAAALVIVALAAWHLPHTFFQEPKTAGTAASDMEGTVFADTESALDSEADDETYMFTVTSGDPSYRFQAKEGGNGKLAAPAQEEKRQGVPATGAMNDIAVAGSADAGIEEDQAVIKRSISQGSPDIKAEEDAEDVLSSQDSIAHYSFRGVTGSDRGDSEVIPEEAPDVPENELLPIDLEPFEVPVDFSRYCAVVTLTEGTFEEDYLRQTQENGDVWYLLPRSVLYDNARELDQLLPSYELRTTGPDLTKDAANVLLIVPAAQG